MSTANGLNLQTTSSPGFAHTYNYAVTHVFFPVEIPRKNDYTLENDLSLARAVCAAAHAHTAHAKGTAQWHHIAKMLDSLQASVTSEDLDRTHVASQLRGMQTGDILVFFVRPQNAAIVVTRQDDCTLFESFGVPPCDDAVEKATESLICSYPWSAVETPNEVFDNGNFQFELANFLSHPHTVGLDLPGPPPATRQYITALLTNISRGVGRSVNIPRITKHVRGDIIREREYEHRGEVVWRRSSLWLLIRITIQMAVDQSSLGFASYKQFILFFICTLARDPNNTNTSSDLLHLMLCKILRRLSKLGSSTPDWLSELALNTCSCLQDILDARWQPSSIRPSLFQNPSPDELRRDTQLSLLDSGEYIRNALANHGHKSLHTPSHPSHRRRGAIEDFLSSDRSFLEEAYDADPDVTLYDVEKSVEEGIDDWIACVTDAEDASMRLEILMDKYMSNASTQYSSGNPEGYSIMLLTGIELFVALDKVVLKEIPMLADYSPEIPTAFLEQLLLRKTTSLHRLARAYQYISARHSRSRPGWSVLSNKFTEDSFSVRYYDQSPHLQQLKARIEQDAILAGRDSTQFPPVATVAHACGGYQKYHQYIELAGGVEVSRSPLPASPLHAKVVVFELDCPPPVRVWRSAAPHIAHYFADGYGGCPVDKENLLGYIPALQRYIVNRQGPPLPAQIHFAYSYSGGSQSQSTLALHYAVLYPDPIANNKIEAAEKSTVLFWEPEMHYRYFGTRKLAYSLRNDNHKNPYLDDTSHTSNDVLAAQADCPTDLSLDEFIAFAHLRSGGSLQWLNILRGLRSRDLNLRRDRLHFLLAHAVAQVGPLDLNTGEWIWHRELQDSSFCNVLLDELDSLFVEVGAASVNGVIMSTISLLLTRVLVSSPSERVSDRAAALLRSVRRKTFNWIQELRYDLVMAPMNRERSKLLCNMAATCRSTFDIDPATLRKVLHSAEDVDALLSCALLIRALRPGFGSDVYARVLLERDHRLSRAVEENLRGVILADPSDYGVDLAVGKVFASHKPGALRWERLHRPNSRWLTCETKAVRDQPPQIVHVNLLDGELRVDGQPLGGLPYAVWNSQECQHIFRDQGFFLIRSNLPGMDFTALSTTSEHKVHFSLRGDDLVVRAQSNQTNEILELIPSEKFQNDLPTVLVDGHVHWLNLSAKFIEIRPLERLWEQSSDNWRIDCTSGQYRMYKGCETLVDIRSPTWAMVAQCFERLNNLDYGDADHGDVGNWWANGDSKSLKNLLITISPINLFEHVRLSVALPLYGLSFFVNKQGELESRDFKDMIYDENQCIGALFGLKNILVLRQKTHLPDELIPRCVLIPSGFPKKHGDHEVRIHTWRSPFERREPLNYHIYVVDTELGCLTGNGSLTSTQYLADLHATTSCHRPDPLTGKTGAQAALSLLQSAGCRSIMKLKALRFHYKWILTQNPQIRIAYKNIQRGYYWNHNEYSHISGEEKHAARRAAYLFPWHGLGPAPPEDYDYNDGDRSIMRVPAKPGLPTPPHPISLPRYVFNHHAPWQVTLDRLLSNRPTPELPACITLSRHSTKTSPDDVPELKQLFSLLMSKSNPSFQREYIARLSASAQHVCQESRTTCGAAGENPVKTLEEHYMQCRANYLDAVDVLKKSLGPTTDPHEQALERFGQWPPITPDVLLRYLASAPPIDVSLGWKRCLVSLALLLSGLQRARRLLRFALDGLKEEFSMELANEGCDGWKPEEHPDWLLIQIQGNFLIRRTQAEVAVEMMSPESGGNTVMQVNMGEGKSSVIIPIAAAALADGNRLVRVIVPRALTVQMFELLVARLGGLANRPIYHLPFSRSPEYNHGGKVPVSLQINDLQKLMSQCVAERGILLVQPEHVVSLQLMSVEEQICKSRLVANPLPELQKLIYKHVTTVLAQVLQLPGDSLGSNMFQFLSQSPNYTSKKDTTLVDHHDDRGGESGNASDNAFKWLNLQKWIRHHARDILDESDEILHPRFQLIYTIGPQQYMDGYPDRWTITQQVLRLVKNHIHSLSTYAPDFIQYESYSPGSFPHVRFVRADVGQRLISSIVEDVTAGRLVNFNFQNISAASHRAIRSFISDEDVLPDTAKRVEEYTKGSHRNHLWSGLLILRGLLACNILLSALAERRWRVDYGLLPQKRFNEYSHNSPPPTMLAVPYRAKDVPAPNTQFSHPDITIILTCLSYYYTGLTEEQLRVTFEILLDQDDPSAEYALWVKEHDCETLEESLQELGEINLGSSEQWDKVTFPHFTRNKAAIDFYLSQVVFSKEAKEFPWKISGSSWDLAEKRENVITGFSGTNDSHWMLPMSITQCDLDHQQGSNARVLACLLQPQNDFYMVTHENGERWTTLGFLRTVATQQPEIRILLDVGAQILDLSNHEVAKAWLYIARDTAGAIYFDENDELMVLTKNGNTQSMLSSSLSQQLNRCVVYLDHAHTRGTDIKLPTGSRAAVTLGPKVTKDGLVQGCMRMRKLGHGHSVMFFAPLQVDQSIRGVVGKKDSNARVTTIDIVCWAIHETWTDIQRRAPYWAQQGMSHKSRSEAWSRFCNNELGPERLSEAWLQPELKSLTDLYAPCETKKASSTLLELDPEVRQRCRDLGVLSLRNAEMEEEQEREVCREREREREVELPPKGQPVEHCLHPDVVKFVNTGAIPPLHSGSAFRPVFATLEKSSAVTREADVWSPFVLATVDFCKTIDHKSAGRTMDQYLRPVQWILSRQKGHEQVLVLLSPFEVNCLMPDIRASEYVHLHVYAPRMSRRMKPSDDLKLYSIPPLPSNWTPPWALIDQLNVFAGQLYLRDQQSYLRLCHFLGVPAKASPTDTTVRWNLFNIPGSFEENEIRFLGSPLPSVMALLAIRNRGRPFAWTHMGKILQGQLLTEKDFDQPTLVVSDHNLTTCDTQIPHDAGSVNTPQSPLDMECETQDNLEQSMLSLRSSCKRGLERAEISDVDSEPPQKRLCTD